MDGGGESIAGGGGDPDPDGNGAWLSEVHRIQNPYLYTYATLRICIALHCMLRRNDLTKSLPVVAREHFDLGLECELLRNVATYGTYLVNRLPDLLLLRRRYYMFHKDWIAALEVRTNAFWGYAKNDRFSKAGSGQTQGNAEKEGCFIAQGDAVVALYHVPHNATRNENPSGSPRYQLYFRVTSGRRAPYKSAGDEAAAASRKTLVDLWSEWDGMQAVLPRLRAELKADGARASKLLLDVTAPAAPAKL